MTDIGPIYQTPKNYVNHRARPKGHYQHREDLKPIQGPRRAVVRVRREEDVS